MRKVTTWSPDTCDCVLHYEWDTAESEDVRVHTPVSAAYRKVKTPRRWWLARLFSPYASYVETLPRKTCPVHAQHSQDYIAHYEAVLAENQHKNRAIGVLEEMGVNPSSVAFSYEEERRLTLWVPQANDMMAEQLAFRGFGDVGLEYVDAPGSTGITVSSLFGSGFTIDDVLAPPLAPPLTMQLANLRTGQEAVANG